MSGADSAPTSYTPAQQRVIDLLGRGAEGDAVGVDVVAELRTELQERLAPVAERVPEGSTLFVGKTPLQQFDQCEAHWQVQQTRQFAWSVPAARGTVAHKAIELGHHWRGEADPGRLVDEAVARLSDGDASISSFLRTLTTVDLAELRQAAVSFVTSFEECFPPLKSRWRPVIEGGSRLSLHGGRIELFGRPDLTLGHANRGGKVIIDLKTGRPSRHHTDDLRFYALVDACKVGVAPRKVATVYLDSGTPVSEAVTAGVLEAATERIVRSAEAMVHIRTNERAAQVHAGPQCRWCPAASAGCDAGAAWLAAREDGDMDRAFWWGAEEILELEH